MPTAIKQPVSFDLDPRDQLIILQQTIERLRKILPVINALPCFIVGWNTKSIEQGLQAIIDITARIDQLSWLLRTQIEQMDVRDQVQSFGDQRTECQPVTLLVDAQIISTLGNAAEVRNLTVLRLSPNLLLLLMEMSA